MNRAIFLDRDGTINIEKNYLYKIQDFEFISGAEKAIKIINDLEYKVIVITNQSGVSRGFFNEQNLIILHEYINNQLFKIAAKIDKFYYCPHSDKDFCECRKPKLGMYLEAVKEFNINLKHSYIIGDKISDILPHKDLNCNYGLVLTGHGIKQNKNNIPEEFIYKDIYDFVLTRLLNNKIKR